MQDMSDSDALEGRALALFDHYADLPQKALSAALEALKREDAALHARLASLLRADARPHSFVSPLQWLTGRGESSSVAARGDDTSIWRAGTRLGAWCVDSVIGIGGMGVVYAAHRADGWYEQRIALKTIRAELISPALLVAFSHERNHLARLEHPAIASLVDAGISADGQPWLAMQRVVGEPIDVWCDAQRLTLRARIGLFIDACAAVGHAHEHGILHQDIKPSNLLVAHDGNVKLLDFGLSALLSPHPQQRTARVGVSCGYAAPEVFRGAAPSVAIDVYALGVVLYRLLCSGQPRHATPFADAWVSAVAPATGEAAPCPSLLARNVGDDVAQQRGVRDGRRLSRAIAGDLDAIAMRSIHHDAAQRYASVDDLRADLQAWLEHRPIAARAGDAFYRASRFMVRNARPIAVTAVLATVLLCGGVIALQQQQRAREDADNGELLSQLFEQSLGVAALTSLGSAPLSSQALLDDAERKLRAAAVGDRPLFLTRGLIALARARLARAEYVKAEALLMEARALGGDDRLQLARTNAALAQLLNLQAKSIAAERLVREGLQALPRLDGFDDDLVELDLRMQLSRARWNNADPYGSLAILDAAVEKAEAIGDAGVPALSELLGQRGYVNAHLFRNPAAERDLRRALALIGQRSPAVHSTVTLHLANALISSGDFAEAHRLATGLLIESIKLYGPTHPETGRVWVVAGKTWFYANDMRRSRIALRQGEAILRNHVDRYHSEMISVALFQGALDFARGDLERASVQSQLALEIAEHAYGPRHELTLRRKVNAAADMIFRAERLQQPLQGALYQKAERLLSEVLRVGQQQNLPVWYARDKYVMVALHLGRIDEAEREALNAVKEIESLFGRGSNFAITAKMGLIKVRIAQKRHDNAAMLCAEELAAAAADGLSNYSDYLVMELILDNEISRGDPARIRREYRRLREFSQQNGFMTQLEAKPVPGIRKAGG